MDVVCVGGGPAGLYFAICATKLDGVDRIRVLERDPRGATFGWGVTYREQMLDLMLAHDPVSAQEIRARSVTWREQEWRLRGKSVHFPHVRYSLERATLLDVLARRAIDLGVDVQYGRPVVDPAELADADLVVAADGVGSVLRRGSAEDFGTTIEVGRNRFIWLGTDHVFAGTTFSFEQTPAGWVWMHAYPSSPTSSTCVVECSPETWHGLQLDTMGVDQGLRMLETVFAEALGGGRFLGQSRAESSRWLRFQHLTNRTWFHRNVVLVGDAAHATHFTMASGTRYALKDAVHLARALQREPDVPTALRRYDGRRRESANEAVAFGRRRAAQWEHMEPLLERDVLDFVHARRGVPEARLRRLRPLYRAQQWSAVRVARGQAGAAGRWYRDRRRVS